MAVNFVREDELVCLFADHVNRNGDALLSGDIPLTLDPTSLKILVSRLHSWHDGEESCEPVSDELDLIDQYVRQFQALKIALAKPEPGLLRLELSLFHSLSSLELKNVQVSHVVDLCDIYFQLKRVVIYGPVIEALDDLLINAVRTEQDREIEASMEATEHAPVMKRATVVQWPRLRTLRATHCRLTGVTTSLSAAPFLEALDLSHNAINTLSSFEVCTFLTSLDLSYNHISNVMDANENLGNVKRLSIRHNGIESVAGLDKLYALEVLDVGDNVIASMGDVAALLKLPCLSSLWLDGNPITCIPRYRRNVMRQVARTPLSVLEMLDGREFRWTEADLEAEDDDVPTAMEVHVPKPSTSYPKKGSPMKKGGSLRKTHRVALIAEDGSGGSPGMHSTTSSVDIDAAEYASSPSKRSVGSVDPETLRLALNSDASESPPAFDGAGDFENWVKHIKKEAGELWLVVLAAKMQEEKAKAKQMQQSGQTVSSPRRKKKRRKKGRRTLSERGSVVGSDFTSETDDIDEIAERPMLRAILHDLTGEIFEEDEVDEAALCSNCRGLVPADARFCGHCGTPVAGAAGGDAGSRAGASNSNEWHAQRSYAVTIPPKDLAPGEEEATTRVGSLPSLGIVTPPAWTRRRTKSDPLHVGTLFTEQQASDDAPAAFGDDIEGYNPHLETVDFIVKAKHLSTRDDGTRIISVSKEWIREMDTSSGEVIDVRFMTNLARVVRRPPAVLVDLDGTVPPDAIVLEFRKSLSHGVVAFEYTMEDESACQELITLLLPLVNQDLTPWVMCTACDAKFPATTLDEMAECTNCGDNFLVEYFRKVNDTADDHKTDEVHSADNVDDGGEFGHVLESGNAVQGADVTDPELLFLTDNMRIEFSHNVLDDSETCLFIAPVGFTRWSTKATYHSERRAQLLATDRSIYILVPSKKDDEEFEVLDKQSLSDLQRTVMGFFNQTIRFEFAGAICFVCALRAYHTRMVEIVEVLLEHAPTAGLVDVNGPTMEHLISQVIKDRVGATLDVRFYEMAYAVPLQKEEHTPASMSPFPTALSSSPFTSLAQTLAGRSDVPAPVPLLLAKEEGLEQRTIVITREHLFMCEEAWVEWPPPEFPGGTPPPRVPHFSNCFARNIHSVTGVELSAETPYQVSVHFDKNDDADGGGSLWELCFNGDVNQFLSILRECYADLMQVDLHAVLLSK